MSRFKEQNLKPPPTLEDFGIDPTRPDWCPRCRTDGLELFETKVERLGLPARNELTRWHCKKCGWTDSLTRHAGHAMIATAGEIAPAILRWHQTGPPKGESLGFGEMMDNLYRVRRGEWTVVTGYPGHGKSQWVDAAMVNLADSAGWKFAIFSPENVPYEQHIRGLMQKFAGKRFYGNDAMTREEVLLARAWLNQHFFFVDGDEITFEGLLAQFWKLVKANDIQGVLIDPWNELESEVPHGMFKGDYIGSCLKRFRSFCKAAHVHGWIVAHPSKSASQAVKRTIDDEGKRPVVRLSDISDTAHFENKCFVGVSVWRDPGDPDRANDSKIVVLKHRTEGVGRPGAVTLNWNDTSTMYHGPDKLLENGRFPMDRLKIRLDKAHGNWVNIARREEKDWWLAERPLPWKRIKPMGHELEMFVLEGKDGVFEAEVTRSVDRLDNGGKSNPYWSAIVFPTNNEKGILVGGGFKREAATREAAFIWAEQTMMGMPEQVVAETAPGAGPDDSAPHSDPDEEVYGDEEGNK